MAPKGEELESLAEGDPQDQAESPTYQRVIPQHPDLQFLLPYIGQVREPQSFDEELIEYIDSWFTFDGFPGFEEGVSIVADILEKYDIDLEELLEGVGDMGTDGPLINIQDGESHVHIGVE